MSQGASTHTHIHPWLLCSNVTGQLTQECPAIHSARPYTSNQNHYTDVIRVDAITQRSASVKWRSSTPVRNVYP